MYDNTIAAASNTDNHNGQPSNAFTMLASKYRFTPAIRICATAKLIPLTRCAAFPNRRNMNSGTLRTFEP